MAKANVLNGKDLMLWIDGKVVALSTGCTINLSAETSGAETKDDGMWTAPEVVGMSWTANNESVDSADEERTNDQVYAQLFDLFVAGEPVEITVGVPTNKNNTGLPEEGWTAPTQGYGGKALMTALDRTGNKGSNGSISVSLQGVGALEKL